MDLVVGMALAAIWFLGLYAWAGWSQADYWYHEWKKADEEG